MLSKLPDASSAHLCYPFSRSLWLPRLPPFPTIANSPAAVLRAAKAVWRLIEFFTANIRNKNTRAAYAQCRLGPGIEAPSTPHLSVLFMPCSVGRGKQGLSTIRY